MIAQAIAFSIDGNPEDYTRLALTFSVQAYTYFYILFLLVGTRQVLKEDKIPSHNYWFFGLLIIGVSILTTFLFYNDPAASSERYFLRVGFKSLITSISFISAGILLLRRAVLGHGLGHRMLYGSLVLFGLMQGYYFMVVLVNSTGGHLAIPAFFGVADLILISCMGLSMIIGLLEDERSKLKKANQELDNFLYRTSHDLRSPIASVLGLANLARLEMREPKSLEYIAMIEDRVKKLDLVISDILDLSRSTKAEPKIERIDFNKLVEDILSDIRFSKKSEFISFRFIPNPLHIFFADYGQMKIVLSNLVYNAVKYHRSNEPNPYVSIEFRKDKDQVDISIADNGQGIEEEHQEKIFEMFYRASTNSDGTGLGLYLVKEVLDKVNGTITLKSKPGSGSIFTISMDQSKFNG
jgi:signal transduction histidine kinase